MKQKRNLPVPHWIGLKRDGGALDEAVIVDFVRAAATGRIPDYQVAAMLMAIVFRGLNDNELKAWTNAMILSGDRLDLDRIAGPKIDKHSTGGVGDKVSLCVAPAVAACGVNVPMLAGRALGHTGGTLDKLESIRGFTVSLLPSVYKRALGKAGWVIAGQTPKLVPADRVFYALRDATATVESLPLIASSIVSKKVAGGADGLVMDVKFGRGAFLPPYQQSKALARTIVDLAKQMGLPTVALLTAMDQPLGCTVGNALEVVEAIDVLKGQGPEDVRQLTLRLGAAMLVQAGVDKRQRAAILRLQSVLDSGAAYETFVKGVAAQGGDVRLVEKTEKLPRARKTHVIRATKKAYLTRLDARALGVAATLLGAGRLNKADRVDPGVGLVLHAKSGDLVSKNDPLCTVYFSDPKQLERAQPHLDQAFALASSVPKPPEPLVRDTLT